MLCTITCSYPISPYYYVFYHPIGSMRGGLKLYALHLCSIPTLPIILPITYIYPIS